MSDKHQKAYSHGLACIAAIDAIGGDPATVQELAAALKDMTAGWRYIRETHGDLYGVGWDRAEDAARAVLAKIPEAS